VDAAVERVLVDLRWSYGVDRGHRDATSRPLADTPADRCRYCGKSRQRYVGSELDGHGQCMVSKAFKRQLATAMRDPRLNYNLLAAALAVSPKLIRGWFRVGRSA
jgi:hypothetical protein